MANKKEIPLSDLDALKEIPVDDGTASGIAVAKLLKKKQKYTLRSDNYDKRCVAFLKVPADILIESCRDVLPSFCEQVKEHRDDDVITAMTDRYTGDKFEIDCNTLTYIGLQFRKYGFDQDAARCFDCAGELIGD